MIWGFLVGFLLGFSGLPFWGTLLAVAQLVLWKGILEILLRNHWIMTGGKSPYALYLQNLETTGGIPSRPWLGYLVRMVGFGTPIGAGGFLIGILVS